jgi:hypothetical protein
MRLLYRFVAVHPAVHETLILVVARADTVVVAVEAVRSGATATKFLSLICAQSRSGGYEGMQDPG